MSHLKSLTLTIAPNQFERNPKLLRRQSLIERLEEQRRLAADPSFTVLVRRWMKDVDGVKQPFDPQNQVKPWWKADANGSLVLILKNGLKTIEIEKGKPGIVVGPLARLEPVLNTLIVAPKAGELDAALEAASGSGGRGISRGKKAA
jgi:hypothetical protein